MKGFGGNSERSDKTEVFRLTSLSDSLLLDTPSYSFARQHNLSGDYSYRIEGNVSPLSRVTVTKNLFIVVVR